MLQCGQAPAAAAAFGPFDGRVWLNTAHQGPLPRPAVEAAERAAALKAAPHRIGDDDFSDVPERLRALLARLVGSPPEQPGRRPGQVHPGRPRPGRRRQRGASSPADRGRHRHRAPRGEPPPVGAPVQRAGPDRPGTGRAPRGWGSVALTGGGCASRPPAVPWGRRHATAGPTSRWRPAWREWNGLRQLGQRRGGDGITAVFSSDLTRAAQTAAIAFGPTPIPVLYDWRLRECDYGQLNGMPATDLLAGRREHLDRPYPGGESWRQAVTRVGRFLGDLPLRWNGQRILVIGPGQRGGPSR